MVLCDSLDSIKQGTNTARVVRLYSLCSCQHVTKYAQEGASAKRLPARVMSKMCPFYLGGVVLWVNVRKAGTENLPELCNYAIYTFSRYPWHEKKTSLSLSFACSTNQTRDEDDYDVIVDTTCAGSTHTHTLAQSSGKPKLRPLLEEAVVHTWPIVILVKKLQRCIVGTSGPHMKLSIKVWYLTFKGKILVVLKTWSSSPYESSDQSHRQYSWCLLWCHPIANRNLKCPATPPPVLFSLYKDVWALFLVFPVQTDCRFSSSVSLVTALKMSIDDVMIWNRPRLWIGWQLSLQGLDCFCLGLCKPLMMAAPAAASAAGVVYFGVTTERSGIPEAPFPVPPLSCCAMREKTSTNRTHNLACTTTLKLHLAWWQTFKGLK